MQREPSHEQRRHESYTTNDSQDSPQHRQTLCKGDLDFEPNFWRKCRELRDECIHDGSPLWDRLNKRQRKLFSKLVLEDCTPNGDTPHLQRMRVHVMERGIGILTEENERRNHMKASAGAFCVTGKGAWMGYIVVAPRIL